MILRVTTQIVALAFAARLVVRTVRPVVQPPAPAPVPADSGDRRFGVPEATRRAIFKRVADVDHLALRTSEQRFPGQPWSQEDDQSAQERNTARELAPQYGLNLSQVYLIIDEGVREYWPAADGKPLRATITPLDPRKQ